MSDVNLNDIDDTTTTNSDKSFICGVVEGFYGRPWTSEQRKDLFSKLQKWKMNCYLYAPKDDYKHRSYWRELYTVEEAEHLTALIQEAQSHGIVFYYAISPGLDITYSGQKEVLTLKRKLEQVQQLGCNAFAILFDDIDPEMSGADKEVFQSFAHAQVSVTNDIFTHLNQPKFMFCPTQYCSSRAVPTIQTSEYLSTIGTKLAPEIDIMWTGPKVISKTLTVEHIQEVTEVLKRPPVIWDNLHANDYDQARLFLGPYCGRSPNLIQVLRGVVLNPNCEYGQNFVAIHTLGQWSQSSMETTCDSIVSADIKLETEGDDSNEECPSKLSPSAYRPRRALRLALMEWIEDFNRPTSTFSPLFYPQVSPSNIVLASVNTCMSCTTTTTTCPVPATQKFISSHENTQVSDSVNDSNFIPQSNAVMNSLVSENKVVVNNNHSEDGETCSTISQEESSGSGLEPMDCNPSPPSLTLPQEEIFEEAKTTEMVTTDEVITPDKFPADKDQPCSQNSSDTASFSSLPSEKSDLGFDMLKPDEEKVPKDDLTVDDLQLLVDLFYLPFEHGKMGMNFLTDFNWLKINSHLFKDCNEEVMETTKPEVQEWLEKARKFNEMTKNVREVVDKLMKVKNRSILYELYPYVWDIRGVISLMNSYVQWLALGKVSSLVGNYVHGNYTWFSKGWKEAFLSGDQEPWVFRGGLTAELQRLIPVDASNDLFTYKVPVSPHSTSYIIRMYLETDRDKLYDLILKTSDDGKDGSANYSDHPELKGDLMIGCYLEHLQNAILMVVEADDESLVGFCVADPDATNWNAKYAEFLIKLREKFPKVTAEEGSMLSPCEELLCSLYADPESPPPSVLSSYPVALCLRVTTNFPDDSVTKRLLTCILASLRSQGFFSGFVEVKADEKNTLDLYNRLGFREVETKGTNLYLGRSF